MKKIIALVLAILCVGMFCVGCNNTGDDDGDANTYVTITFKQDGEEDIIKQVLKGKNLTDIPLPKDKGENIEEGYSLGWDVTDFTNIRKDMTVNAVKKANSYKIYFDYVGVKCNGAEYMDVTYDKEFTLPTPVNPKGLKVFLRWIDENGQTVTNGVYKTIGDITLKAVWDDYYTDNYTCR